MAEKIKKAEKKQSKVNSSDSPKSKRKKIWDLWHQYQGWIIPVIVIIGTIIWVSMFSSLIQYMPAWMYWVALFISTFLLSSVFSKIPSDSKTRIKRAIRWLPIVYIFIFVFMPSLDQARFDSRGKELQWINIETGDIFHRAKSKVYEDNKGEYFFDPITGDTCRRATDHWEGVYESKKPNTKVVYHAVYDTVVDKTYSIQDINKDGYIKTHVYGYDINSLKNPEIVVINYSNDESVVIARVKKDKKIYASYRNPVASHRYSKLCQDVDASVAIAIKGNAKARVLLLDKKRVRQVLAQK